MSLPVPLAVRMATGRTDRHITRDLRDLSFGWSDPGGYSSCRLSLHRPLRLDPDDVAYYGTVTVYDARNGQTVFDGRLEDPGRSAGDGEVFDLVAVGGQAHTHDRTIPVIYVDRNLDGWREFAVTTVTNGKANAGEDETIFPGEASIVLVMPNGSPVPNQGSIGCRYLPIHYAGQKLARTQYKWDAGRTTGDLRIRAFAHQASSWSTFTLYRDDAANTAGAAVDADRIGTDWTAGRDAPQLAIQWTGVSTTVADEVTWGAFADIAVLATRYNKSGSELLTAADYPDSTVLASQIVEDLLGRLLTEFDGANATVATTSYAIDQLSYFDGVTANQILTDLIGIEAGHTWRVWERNTAGKYRFEWTTIPSTVRYEATVADGYESTGSADGLYNEVTVRWRAPSGHIKTTTRTATSPILTAAGETRRGFLDLGDEVGSAAAADRAGDQWLADRIYPPNAGRLTIARPILDLQTGRMVQPWELRPGLIRVRGINPRVDTLNATTRDGVTVFRIKAAEYSASNAAATLEMDSYAPSAERMLAELNRRAVIRRRR